MKNEGAIAIIDQTSGLEMWKCAFCSRVMKTKSNLIGHIKTHTGEKPFPCPNCEKTFSRKYHMERHLLSVHSETASWFKLNKSK